MDFSRYRGVIKMVLAKHAGKAPEEITDELLKSIEIAQALAEAIEIPDREIRQVLNKTQGPNTAAKPFDDYLGAKERERKPPGKASSPIGSEPGQGKIILISSAPPVAGIDENDVSGEDDIDRWESKPGRGDGCARLQSKLQSVLPRSLTVQLPGFDQPLTLVCGIGSPGIRFVHVSYTIPGDTLGPRYTVMVSQKPEDIDPDAIVDDILKQAAAFYSKEKRTIQPAPLAPIPPPSNQDLQRMLERDRKAQMPNDGLSGDEAKKASEDAAEWGRTRPQQWK